MEWPANSPDLNPIENLWHLVKRNAEKRMPENWNFIPDSMLINLVWSMRRRCELVIENNGERISY